MAYFILSEAVTLSVSGPDAVRYLNSRLSNDIANLSQGQAMLCAALSAQGRTEGLFLSWRRSDDVFMLMSDAGDGEVLKAAVGQFLVTERVDVENLSEHMTVLHVSLEKGSDEFSVLATDGRFAIRHKRGPQIGTDYILPADQVEGFLAELQKSGEKELSPAERQALRILGGRPSPVSEITSDRVFPEFGIPEAISSTKGCYVGQEVVERIISRGRSPRIFIRLRGGGDEPPPAGSDVFSVGKNGASVGKVVSSAVHPESGEALCFCLVKNDPLLLESGFEINDSPFTVFAPE